MSAGSPFILQIGDSVTIPLCTANVFNSALESRITLHSYPQRYWEAQFPLMTNWVRHTDNTEDLCLCQFSLWSIAEFAKFFPFVTRHLAGPHALFHARVWRVPSWPRGCMHYPHFIPPRIPTFCLYSSRYKIPSCSTVGESLCHRDFYGSVPKKERRNWTGGFGRSQKVFTADAPGKHRPWCSQQLTLLQVPCQAAINMSDLHGNWQVLKEQPAQNERLCIAASFRISFKWIFCSSVNKWKDRYEWLLL